MMMKNKAAILIGAAVFLIVLFLLSYKITVKIKTGGEKPPASEVINSEAPGSEVPGSETPSAEASASEAEPSQETEAAPAEDNSLPEPTVINMPADSSWCLVLLNKYYRMNDNYEPLVELVFEDSGVWLDERVAEKFRDMYSAAMENGVTLTPAAGYVSLERQRHKFSKQAELYTAQGMNEDEAKAKAAFTVLPAGCNESNYGLAVDIGWLSEDFARSPAYAWLCSHAAEYGFVERYTAEKTGTTHFNAQPWHWRYVGVDAAKEMSEQNLCLEEYVGKVN